MAKAAKEAEVPIRIGVNSGSLPEDLLKEYGHDDPRAFAKVALREAAVLEEMDFRDIVISVKSSSPTVAFWAYHLLAQECDYPLHLGITEAGIMEPGTIKSSVGIGALFDIQSTIAHPISAV